MVAVNLILAHGSEDRSFVVRLKSGLAAESPGMQIDSYEMGHNDSILDRIRSDNPPVDRVLGLVISRNSVGTQWLANELGPDIVLRLENNLMFPMLIFCEDCDVPLLLRGMRSVSFSGEYNSGIHDLGEVLRTLRHSSSYLQTMVRRLAAEPEVLLPDSVLSDLADKSMELQIDRGTFDVLFERIMRTDIYPGCLFLAGSKFHRESDLLEKALSLRPLPFPNHRGFITSYAEEGRVLAQPELILDYVGAREYWQAIPVRSDVPLPLDVEKKLVEVVEDLYTIGYDAQRAVMLFRNRCVHFSRRMLDLALRLRDEVAIYEVLRDAATGFPDEDTSIETWSAVAQSLDDVPEVRRVLVRAFTEGIADPIGAIPLLPQVVPCRALERLDLFPVGWQRFFIEKGLQSEYPAVREAAQRHRDEGQ